MLGTPKLSHWLSVIGLAIIWGSAYVLNEIALQSFSPVTITALRLVFAAITLIVAMRLLGLRLPSDRRSWRSIVAVSLVGNCLPFFLVTSGQVSIESNLTGLLLATTPLFVLTLAHFALPDEPMRLGKAIGFAMGFAGVAILIGPESLRALAGDMDGFIGQLFVLGAAFFYALSAILVRHGPQHHVLVYSTAVMIVGSVILVPVALATDPNLLETVRVATAGAWASIGLLSVVVTGLSALVFFYVVREAGAGFQALTNYLIPLWAVLLGWLVLGEVLPARAWLAMAVILLGLCIVQYAPGPPLKKNPGPVG